MSKFHIGMLRASALAVLNAIAKDDYQAFISKAAKLITLAHKLGIDLNEALPTSVVKLIKDLTWKLYLKSGLKEHIFIVWFYVGGLTIPSESLEVLKSLVCLPKSPALR